MEVALNFGVPLGGVARKDTKTDVAAAPPGLLAEGSEGAIGEDGNANDFRAAVLEQSLTANSDEAETQADIDPVSFVLQTRNSTSLAIDSAEILSVEIQSEASTPLPTGNPDAVLPETQTRPTVPPTIKAVLGELQNGAAAPSVTKNIEAEPLNPSTVIATSVTKNIETEPFIPSPDATTSATENNKAEPLNPLPGIATSLAIDSIENNLREPQPLVAPVAKVNPESALNDPAGRVSVQSKSEYRENLSPKSQSDTLVLSSSDDVGLAPSAYGSNDLTGRSQNIDSTTIGKAVSEQTALEPKAPKSEIDPRRPILQSATAIATQDDKKLLFQKSSPAILGGQPQPVLLDGQDSSVEEVLTAEKLQRPPSTLSDSSPPAVLRATPLISPNLAAGNLTPSLLGAGAGDVMVGDLGLDMPADFSTDVRVTGRPVSISQPFTSPAVLQSTVVNTTAQIVAAIKANRRADTIEIRLDPPELGRVKIEFTMDTVESVRAMLSAERGDTLEHMRKNISDLAAQLKDAGFKSMEFEFSKNSGAGFSKESNTSQILEPDGADFAHQGQGDVIYLSMRSDAQLDLLA